MPRASGIYAALARVRPAPFAVRNFLEKALTISRGWSVHSSWRYLPTTRDIYEPIVHHLGYQEELSSNGRSWREELAASGYSPRMTHPCWSCCGQDRTGSRIETEKFHDRLTLHHGVMISEFYKLAKVWWLEQQIAQQTPL
jgi:hypothetical protein